MKCNQGSDAIEKVKWSQVKHYQNFGLDLSAALRVSSKGAHDASRSKAELIRSSRTTDGTLVAEKTEKPVSTW